MDERCDVCGFDSAGYTRRDALGTLRSLTMRWRWTVEGVRPDVLDTRPAPATWSVAEYAAHSRDVTGLLADLFADMEARDGIVLAPPPPIPDPASTGDIEATIDELDVRVARLHDDAAALDANAAAWSHRARFGDGEIDLEWVVGHAVHDASHHLMDAGRGLHALGAGAQTAHGQVAQLNTSGGGVPKLPVDDVAIGRRGLEGDVQRARQHHGRPWQAVSLWSLERIDALRSEGHPIGPGAAGENVTVSGIDWSTVRPGVRIGVGDALLEVTAWATPCAKNAQWFLHGDIGRMGHDRHPGWSRAYASVVRPGHVRAGDPVVVEP